MVSSGILRFSLAKRSCLTYLQPIRIRAANAFVAFLVWPARRRVLQRAVCHLAARIDNNIERRVQLNAEKSRMFIQITLAPGKNSVTRCANLCFVGTMFISSCSSGSISLYIFRLKPKSHCVFESLSSVASTYRSLLCLNSHCMTLLELFFGETIGKTVNLQTIIYHFSQS